MKQGYDHSIIPFMPETHASAFLLKSFYRYLSQRKSKGLLGPRFLARSFRFNLARAFSDNKMNELSPLVVTMAITSRCPHNCFHCSEGYKKGYELPLPVVLDTVDGVAKSGCPAIAFTGGEPLLRKDLPEILDRVPMSMMKVIYTSGFGLDDMLAEKLRRTSNLLVCVSIDHSDSSVHDERRGKEGSFDTAIKALDKLADSAVELHVSTLTSRDRLEGDDLLNFARMLRKKGVACLQMFQPRPVGRLDDSYEDYLSPEDEEKAISIARQIGEATDMPLVLSYPALEHGRAFGCCGGYARAYVDSHGNLCPCDFMPLSFGNLNEERFEKLWQKMRGFYEKPGSRCQVKNNRDVLSSDSSSRNVDFHAVTEKSGFRSEVPSIFSNLGEGAYRLLLANLMIASIVSAETGQGCHE